MRSNKTLRLTRGALIAAAYVALTYLSALLSLASGPVQFRLSEIFTVLPVFFPEAIPGLTLGCLLAGILTAEAWFDILFGTCATLIGAVGAYLLRRHPRLSPLPTIAANALILPLVLRVGYGMRVGYPLLMLSIALGETVTAGVGGEILLGVIRRTKASSNRKDPTL